MRQTEFGSQNWQQAPEKGHSRVAWALDSLLEGFWGHSLVTGSKGALGVHQHPTRLGAVDELQLLRAAFRLLEAGLLLLFLLYGPGAETKRGPGEAPEDRDLGKNKGGRVGRHGAQPGILSAPLPQSD